MISDRIDALAAQTAADGADLPSLNDLAQLWVMIADLDPGLASRLPGYCPELPQQRP